MTFCNSGYSFTFYQAKSEFRTVVRRLVFTRHLVQISLVTYDPSIVKQFSCPDIVAEPKSEFRFLKKTFCWWCCPFWCCKSCPPGHFPILWLQTFIIKTQAQRASTFCKYFRKSIKGSFTFWSLPPFPSPLSGQKHWFPSPLSGQKHWTPVEIWQMRAWG